MLFALSLAFLFTACPSPMNIEQFSLNNDFTLKYGASAQSKEDPDFTIRFDQVSNDSRCPVNVECIVAGQADVQLTLKKGAETEEAVLTYFPGGGNRENSNTTVFNGYTVKVTAVEPEKKADSQIKPEDYKVKLIVTK